MNFSKKIGRATFKKAVEIKYAGSPK